jgi:hypothetical protein
MGCARSIALQHGASDRRITENKIVISSSERPSTMPAASGPRPGRLVSVAGEARELVGEPGSGERVDMGAAADSLLLRRGFFSPAMATRILLF